VLSLRAIIFIFALRISREELVLIIFLFIKLRPEMIITYENVYKNHQLEKIRGRNLKSNSFKSMGANCYPA